MRLNEKSDIISDCGEDVKVVDDSLSSGLKMEKNAPNTDEVAQQVIRRPVRLGDEVYDAIYSQLMSHKIPPGGRISVDSLVRELGVSQTPIREALSRLEAAGLVVKTHLVGYSAARQMSLARFNQLYEIRLLLEPFASSRAALNMNDEALAALETLATKMWDIKSNNRSGYADFARIDSEFHNAIAMGSGNELVFEALAKLHTHVHLFRLFFHPAATSEANDEHARIVAAIRQRDPAAAAETMRAHIELSRNRFISVYRE
jgi:DNA-binding GntR family transcriptional regulator